MFPSHDQVLIVGGNCIPLYTMPFLKPIHYIIPPTLAATSLSLRSKFAPPDRVNTNYIVTIGCDYKRIRVDYLIDRGVSPDQYG